MPRYRILDGLPPYGPLALSFPPGFGERGKEGFVVEFNPDTPERWVGNFSGGLGGYTGIHTHPNGCHVLVFAHGHGYHVDPASRQLGGEVGGEITGFWEVDDPPGFILERQGLAFVRFDRSGTRWHTRRLSWDGFRELAFTAAGITGLAWTPMGEKWLPFAVDLQTGRSTGGSYTVPRADAWEKLAPQ